MKDKRGKICFFLLIFFLLVFKVQKTWAWKTGPLGIGLFFSERDLSFEVYQGIYTYVTTNPLYLGGKYFYSKKKNNKVQLGKIYIAVRDFYQHEINLGLGFQGVVGLIENLEENNHHKFDIFSIGLSLFGEWILMQGLSKLPFGFNAYFFYSPPILSFSDIERIITIGLGFNYYITITASIGLRYEYSKIFIDEYNNLDWENSITMLGVSISF